MTLSRYRRDAEHFEVVTPFDWNERHFSEGETFPWREMGLAQHQCQMLWVANKIRVADAPPPAPPAPDAKPPKRPRAGA